VREGKKVGPRNGTTKKKETKGDGEDESTPKARDNWNVCTRIKEGGGT